MTLRQLFSALVCSIILLALMTTTVLTRGDIDRSQPPKGKPTPQMKLPDIQKATLQNGLGVWLVEMHKLPTVALNMVVQSGSDQDPLDMPGLASMTADVIDEGTKTRDVMAIASSLEEIGANMSFGSSFDGSFASLSTLSRNLDKAMAIYADVLTHPTFPETEFQRLRKQRLVSLKQQKDSPVAIANNAFNFILYGDAHPYGANPGGIGTETSLPKMKRDDLAAFYETHYKPNNATLIIVGDVTMKDILPKLEAAFADWKAGEVKRTELPPVQPIQAMQVFLIDKPGAPQSEIRIGYPALSRNTPDFFAVQLMNRMLGGQFTSRINLNLREKHGFTYGARSGFSYQKGPGPFIASAGVTTEKTDSSLTEFLHEINLMREKGLSSDELVYSKKGTQGNFLLNFETPAQFAGSLQNIVLYNLPEDYYINYLQNIDGITTADIQRISQKYLNTAAMDIVVVGDLAKIKDGIEKLNLGKVTICDANGKPIE